MLESTTHSLAVDVVLKDTSPAVTLLGCNFNGTYFVESLKDTNRNGFGYVDYERVYGIEGLGIANIVSNVQELESGQRRPKKLKSYITFDDGSNLSLIPPPTEDAAGQKISCDASDIETCSLPLPARIILVAFFILSCSGLCHGRWEYWEKSERL